ncbi:hypothetical protein ACFW81_23680 [Streptomyces angustmyceticus]|uniref:hypothetical protein n=1 Tax=Streptomyces angustmyceticus TaxID=285578 RepID=UPI0036B5F027
MATATAPAAVPDPNDPPNTNTSNGPSGLLASMLAPVEPARPATFNIPAPTAGEGAGDEAVAGASSATYHGSEETTGTSRNNSASIDKKSIWRAWLLAGATRWGKGGGAHNKRLDMLKAKAAAHQVKEARQVSVNRSGGLLPGKGSAGSGAAGNSGGSKGNSGGGKSASDASGKGPAKGPGNERRHSNGDAHKGSSGRSGGSSGGGAGGAGRGPGGGGSAGSSGGGKGTHGRGGVTPKSPKVEDASRNHGPKPSKTDLTKGKDRSRDGDAGGSKNGAPGPAGGTGKSGSNGGSAGGNRGTKNPGPGTGDGSGSGADTGKKNKVNLTKDRPAKGDKHSGKDGASGKGPTTKPGKHGPVEAPSGKNTGPGAPATAGGKDPKDNQSKGKNGKDPKAQPGSPASGKPFSLKESRETGYRDGTRAAKAVAHAKAYRDGVKDGYHDVTEAADRQKAQLDKAHQERKKAQQTARDKETDVSAAGSSADHHKPQPIEVKGIDAHNLRLGGGADKDSLTRGEVRSLKTFERRLQAKASAMKKIAETTKSLKAHAEAQASKATALMESARAVKGGTKLIAALVKTSDAAKAQAGQAEQIHKRAVRAADRCTAILANAQTRYGGMYKAVVDSDETSPAEMAFYQEGAASHG